MRLALAALLLAAALALAPAASLQARPDGRAYSVDVWSSVLFGTDGRASEIRIVDEAKLPAAFAAQVRQRLQNARVEPRIVDGHPATFRTGVQMGFRIEPGAGGGTVRMTGLRMAPLPVESHFVAFPHDIASSAGWDGTVTLVCHVQLNGRCGATDVRAQAGIPESAKRWAAASFDRWRFEPQQVDGAPVEGDYFLRVTMVVDGPVVEDFRQDKFERLMIGK